MHLVPQVEPISRLQRDHNSVFEQLRNGPVFLTQRSKTTAVMVSAEDWNATAKRLAFFERMLLGDKADTEIQAGNFHTQEEVDAILATP